MDALFFLPLLVLALWAISRAANKHKARLALAERLAVVMTYDDMVEAHHQAMLTEYLQ